jgi:NADH-quinone oxidoreductase subunit H
MDLTQLLIVLGKILLVFFVVQTAVAYLTYAERRLLAFIQIRLGPNRVGPFGLLQPLADGIKFIFKEDIIPNDVSRFLYVLAPIIAIVPALMTFAVIPLGTEVELFGQKISLYITSLNVGLLYVFALTSLGVYGIVLAGWSSNNKYSLLGGLRSSAQMVSYELALAMSVVGVLIHAGTLDLVKIAEAQSGFYGVGWFVVPQFLGFIVFFIAVMAETNRVPFDLPEAETELVAGFHTEYSAMKFAMFFMAEYANMMTASSIATILFFGGWNGPFLDVVPQPYSALLGIGYFCAKVAIFLFIYIWVRGTLPRFRFDQLMDFGWKLLLPLSIFNIVLTATWKLLAS